MWFDINHHINNQYTVNNHSYNKYIYIKEYNKNNCNDVKYLLSQKIISLTNVENNLIIYLLRKPIPQSN